VKQKIPFFITAFLEGMAVLVIELAGARALAPYFGTSLYVWTAQITATLLFLALGYGLGGRLSRRELPLALPSVFLGAGVWLLLFPFWRVQVLGAAAAAAGIAAGSFLAGSFLYGPPLLCMGAVSPLLIQRLQRGAYGGSAAGGIFFTNTLGGLAGGWLCALALVPHFRLGMVLGGTGAALVVLASAWSWRERNVKYAAVATPLAALLLLAAAPGAKTHFNAGGLQLDLLYSQPAPSGLIQVLKVTGGGSLTLLLDGVIQGGMHVESGLPVYNNLEYMANLSWRFHPRAKTALLLGLGSGALARQLHARGMRVEAVEIEPEIIKVSRKFFRLPAEVTVHNTDARTFINSERPGYDLILVNVFAGEAIPWHLMTRESLVRMKALLNPGGRLVVSTVTSAPGTSPGLELLESGLCEVFGSAMVFTKKAEGTGGQPVNACLIAGENLKINDGRGYPGRILPELEADCRETAATGRPARHTRAPSTDDLGSLDYEDAALRLEFRKSVMAMLGPELLGS